MGVLAEFRGGLYVHRSHLSPLHMECIAALAAAWKMCEIGFCQYSAPLLPLRDWFSNRILQCQRMLCKEGGESLLQIRR